jgi:hypothetical protein
MQNPGAIVACVAGALIATESVAERKVPPAHSSAFANSGVMFNVPASAQAPLPTVAAQPRVPGEHPLGGPPGQINGTAPGLSGHPHGGPPGQEVRRVAADGGESALDVMRSCR